MQRLIEAFKIRAAEFIEQRHDMMLVVSSCENDMGVTLAVLRDLEQESGDDPYLMFGGDFKDPLSFMDGVVTTLEEEHRITSEVLEKQGNPPLPPIPDFVRDRGRPVIPRMLEAIRYVRSLFDTEGVHRLVWVLFPTEVHDWQAYGLLIAGLSPLHGTHPWMRGVRLIVRDDAPVAHLPRVLGRSPRVRFTSVDFGPEAQQAVLEEESQDPATSEERRAQALYSLAIIDYGHNRATQAVQRFDQALGIYKRNGNRGMEAMTRQGLGSVYDRNGDLEMARHWYESAVPPAAESKAPLVLLQVAESLGWLGYREKRFEEAYAYYDLCDKLAGVMLDPGAKVKALEHKGLCEEGRRDVEKAVACWEAAEGLCRKVDLPEEMRQVILEHLHRGYGVLGWKEKQAAQ
jgi:Tfp pilus assembly protein PilF